MAPSERSARTCGDHELCLAKAQSEQTTNLLNVTHSWCNIEAFQFGVHRVQTADEAFEEELICLRQTNHHIAVDIEGGDTLTAILNLSCLYVFGTCTHMSTSLKARKNVRVKSNVFAIVVLMACAKLLA